jgi:Zn-dependent M28 family amino/carboxypeptidase
MSQLRHPYWSPQGHRAVKDYIHHFFGQWGEVEQDPFTIRGQIHHNLVLRLPGNSNSHNRPTLLVGAHYDAVPGSPGADDNASGVAVLLECARLWSLNPGSYPLQLVAFDMEEEGCLGSKAYATKLKQTHCALRLMVSLEMLGYCSQDPGSQSYPSGLEYFYPNVGNFIALIGNWPTLLTLIYLKRYLKQANIPCEWLPAGQRGMLVPDTRRSDHAPFWDQGYPAILVTDTGNLRNPHYHRLSDQKETLNLSFLTQVCWGLLGGLSSLP